jgi:hypothetical protein
MKKTGLIIFSFCVTTVSVWAQDEGEESEKGFKKENLFTGGSITLSFFNGQTIIGANPVFGYKLAKWVDAGLSLNFLYNQSRDYYEFDDRVKQTVIGPGVFTRLYPVKFLFVQAQFEHNFNTVKYIPSPGSVNFTEDKAKVDANSLLVGGGFAQGRQDGSNSFFYFSVLVDVLKNVNSPYVNVDYDPATSRQRVTMVPIIRAGVNIGLFQGSYR